MSKLKINKKQTEKISNTKKKTSKVKTIFKGIGYTFLLFCFIGIIAACIAGATFFIYIATNAPEFDENKLYTSEPSVIYDVNGNVIANIGTEDRIILTYDEMPEVLINAIIATEDSKFFQHNGIDLPRFLVASVKQITGGGGGGASTLTMQISKNRYTSTEASGWEGIKRKFTDVYMAVFKIEPAYSKEQILEFYANSFFLGNGYGVEVTAKNYFGKSAKDLNLSEAAMIAGLFQAPGTYNPYKNPEATEERRKTVLYLMHRHGYITDDEYDIALDMTVDKIVKENAGTDIASGIINEEHQLFVDMVLQDVEEETGQNPYTTSMQIYTTLDPKQQKHVSDIMNGETYKWENKEVQAGIAVVDIETGAITAIGGGRNVNAANTLNRAINVRRQIGSTSKPLFDYGPAVEYLNWNTGTILKDERDSYSNGQPISNWDNGYKGFQTIERNLAQSRNIPALRAFRANKSEDIIEFVTNLGLTPDIYSCNSGYRLSGRYCINKENPSDKVDANKTGDLFEAHAIGGYTGETPLTMANAYAAFGNGGYYNEPYSFTKIIYNDTGDVFINKTETKQVMSDSTAYIITHMLVETADYGIDSGSYGDINGIKYAAKTGTTNFDSATKKAYKLKYNAVNDYWVVGYNTKYSIAVWYGYDSIKDGTNRLGSSQHQRLFQAVAKGIFKDKSNFKQPSSVIKVKTETGTGTALLPSDNTPKSYITTSLFISGTEPNQVSTRFNKLDDITDLAASDNGDGSATVTWAPIATPDAFDKNYLLNNLNKTSFPGNDATEYANRFVSQSKGIFGELGYNVYIEKDGQLIFKGWTSGTSYNISDTNGTYKVVVKSCYSKYSANMSNGKSINISITGASIPEEIITEPEDNVNPEDNTNPEDNANPEENNNEITN